jgi:hypothetical protein
MLVPAKEDRVLLPEAVVQAMAAGGVGFKTQQTASKATDRDLELFIVGMWQYEIAERCDQGEKTALSGRK